MVRVRWMLLRRGAHPAMTVVGFFGICVLGLVIFLHLLLPSPKSPTSVEQENEWRPPDRELILRTNTDVPHGNIYFFEMSGKNRLTMEQLCAIESAAVHHPGVPVVVAVNSDSLMVNVAHEVLLKSYKQIKVVPIDPPTWIEETAPPTDRAAEIQGILFSEQKQKGRTSGLFDPHRAAQISDYVRYVTLYKYGGVYFDLDVIVLRPVLGKLENSLGLQEEDFVNQAVVVFDKGHEFLKHCIVEFGNRLAHLEDRETTGGKMVTELSRKWCNVPGITEAMGPDQCQGLQIMPVSAFYPVPRRSWRYLFQDNDPNHKNVTEGWLSNSYVVHFWNHNSADARIKFDSSTQPLAEIARRNCPVISSAALF